MGALLLLIALAQIAAVLTAYVFTFKLVIGQVASWLFK